jgi:hypothetical protein
LLRVKFAQEALRGPAPDNVGKSSAASSEAPRRPRASGKAAIQPRIAARSLRPKSLIAAAEIGQFAQSNLKPIIGADLTY